jgi:hypothetical protein
MFSGILGFLTSISGFIGSGLSALLNWYLQYQAKVAAALQGMRDSIVEHSNDGKISTDEKDSIDAQDADLTQQLNEMNNPKPQDTGGKP